MVDPASSSYTVPHSYVFANTATDQAFSGFFETLPDAARGVSAAAAGRSLPVVNIPDGEGFDRDGARAMAGTIDEEWLREIGVPALPEVLPPRGEGTQRRRTFGREEFGESWGSGLATDRPQLALEDRLATLAAWVARAVARGIDALAAGEPPERILIGGGGAHHRRVVAERVV